jgi:hypothetical protein
MSGKEIIICVVSTVLLVAGVFFSVRYVVDKSEIGVHDYQYLEELQKKNSEIKPLIKHCLEDGEISVKESDNIEQTYFRLKKELIKQRLVQ